MATHALFNLFGKSPFRLLQKHMKMSFKAVFELVPFFEAVIKEDWSSAETIREKVSHYETEADLLKKKLRTNVPKSFLMPVSRSEILKLLSQQEKLANISEDIVNLTTGRRMSLPKSSHESFMKFLQRCVDAAYQARKTIKELDKVFEAGFKGKEIQIVDEMVDVLHHIENETDVIQRQVIQSIHSMEKELSPVDVIFIYKIIEWIGKLANKSQDVGDLLLLMINK